MFIVYCKIHFKRENLIIKYSVLLRFSFWARQFLSFQDIKFYYKILCKILGRENKRKLIKFSELAQKRKIDREENYVQEILADRFLTMLRVFLSLELFLAWSLEVRSKLFRATIFFVPYHESINILWYYMILNATYEI